MTQNLVKNNNGNVASSYQVYQGIEIPNIIENYINSHVSLVDISNLQCLFKYTSRCWEVVVFCVFLFIFFFFIGYIFLYPGGL